MYGIVYTTAGLELLASLGAGETLTITRCMVGRGRIGSAAAARALTDLVQPVASCTSTKPLHKDNIASIQLEYRNDLNGGLGYDLDITEFGVWAQVGSNAEILLLTGRLEDRPRPVSAYTEGGGIEIQRFPVSVAVSDECPVVLGYTAMAFMTAEDVSTYCVEVVLPLFLGEVDRKIAAHNVSPTAHQDIRDRIADLDSRLTLLDLMYNTDVSGNPYTITFESLDGLIVTGVWNKAQARLEW